MPLSSCHRVQYEHHIVLPIEKRERPHSTSLTSDRCDYTVAVFYQLFEEFARPLQLQFITLESLPEVRAVQIAGAKLQRRMPHLLGDILIQTIYKETPGLVLVSLAASARLPRTGHSCSAEETLIWPQEPWCPGEPAVAAGRG